MLVRTSTTRAKSFYSRHGFVEIGEEQRGTRRLALLLYDGSDR